MYCYIYTYQCNNLERISQHQQVRSLLGLLCIVTIKGQLARGIWTVFIASVKVFMRILLL